MSMMPMGMPPLTAGLTNVMSEQMEYDVMGNFKWLSRDGGNANHYDYPHGNQLWYVVYVTNGYAYDANGNATTDGRSGYSIQYNHLNLPRYIPDMKLTYTYDATGRKLSKNNNGSFRNYIDGIEYKPDGTIDFIQTAEGLAQNNGGTYTYHYNLSDHLGNVRYSFDVANGVIGKLEQTDYYPFGMKRNTFASGANNKYLYNGKEMQDELGPTGQEGHYDYGARFYDPVIARWNVVDPLAEKFASINPYAYTDNNPVNNVDPNGMETYYGQQAQDMFRQMQGQTGEGGGDGPGDPPKKKGKNIINKPGAIIRKIHDGYSVSQKETGEYGTAVGDIMELAAGITPIGTGLDVISGLTGETVNGENLSWGWRLAGLIPLASEFRKTWKLTEKGAEIVAKHKFGVFFKSASDGTWWVKDFAGHGESTFKVYEQKGSKLIWKADADKYGNFIKGKHKSEFGKIVDIKDLNIIKKK